FPSIPLTSCNCDGKLYVLAYPGEQLTCRNCSGTPQALDWNNAPAGAPAWSYSSRTYTGSQMVGPLFRWTFGPLVSATSNVTVDDATQRAITVNPDNTRTMIMESTLGSFAPVINLKITGSRTLTPSTTSGLQTGDSVTAPGSVNFVGPDQFGIATGSDPGSD